LLKVNEIFLSIQGESSYSGLPCTFIRLTGCNLRCSFCDTKYAYKRGKSMSLNDLLNHVQTMDCALVEITGGEPLLQEETPELTQLLLDNGFRVLVETNGSLDIRALPSGAVCILDIKCPGSGESEKMLWENLEHLKHSDEVKFVISTREDYEWARNNLISRKLSRKASILFSPCHGRLSPARLAGWILEDRLSARLQLQLHRIIWPGTEHGR